MKNSETDIHLNSLRRALASGNAAVMVGAGFSRNAEGGHQLATWAGTAAELWQALNPEIDCPAFSSGLVTQLGEQYCRAFSTTDLEDLLKRLIPDERISPGPLHDDLLRLPWTEIFTTNYDTLLERAADNIVERAHFTVLSREDIPRSKVLGKRRIVKLHGSFPSQRPFIFSEEDYRTYPEKFSPFVNMVRQSLLENVFCLVGFSGEDPNFLHWIGWVRDMLDKHTLPIYLFVSHEPSFGERKLLESRKVIPVVLPCLDNAPTSDLGRRYKELFEILSQPLLAADSEWGTLEVDASLRTFIENADARFKKFIQRVNVVRSIRTTYPGWLLAPQRTRQSFRRTLMSLSISSEDFLVKQKLESEGAPFVVCLLATYAWEREVLLEPLDDILADLGFRKVLESVKWNISEETDTGRAAFIELGIVSQELFINEWSALALSVLRWKRQQLQIHDFKILENAIAVLCAENRLVMDHVRYEAILLSLYLGEIDTAEGKLGAWIPSSDDAYMAVRRGTLLAEVGDVDAGLASCLDGIQRLRLKQKTNVGSAKYLSEEAWACLVSVNLQRAKRVTEQSMSDRNSNFFSPGKLGLRLADLAARGHDVRREQEKLMNAIDVEAVLPASLEISLGEFDLGRVSSTRRFGLPSELHKKIQSSLSWLELVDRVGIVPRAGNVSFDLSSHVQAGWWVQYADSWPRVLSIPIRGLSLEVLKPLDTSLPAHKTGWFSRFQIAVLDASHAVEMCKKSFRQVEVALLSQRDDQSVRHICEFHLELFSRLVLRCTDPETVLRFARRLIDFHKETNLQKHPQLWKKFGKALGRCIEALDPKFHQDVAIDIFSISLTPEVSAHDHYRGDWVSWGTVLRHFRSGVFRSPKMQRLMRQHITDLSTAEHSQEAGPNSISSLLWHRLAYSSQLNILDVETQLSIRDLLWADRTSWPTRPNFRASLATVWPAPEGIDLDITFRDWILALSLDQLSSPKSKPLGTLKRAWSMSSSSSFLDSWEESLKRSVWPVEDVVTGMKIVKKWWDSEWEHVVREGVDHEEVRKEICDRLEQIDVVIGRSILEKSFSLTSISGEIGRWLSKLIEGGLAMGTHFWVCRIAMASKVEDEDVISSIQQEMSAAFAGNEKIDIKSAYLAVVALIDVREAAGDRVPTLLLQSITLAVGARRGASMTYCIDLLIRISKKRPGWISSTLISLIEIWLEGLRPQLKYQAIVNSELPQDEIPLLRFQCVQLVLNLCEGAACLSPAVRNAWLDDIPNDPLPEIRFIRERREYF